MARIFLSQSSRDKEASVLLRNWLLADGFEAPFLDFDKHFGIPPDAQWENLLYEKLCSCHALLILQTANWAASKWCFAEFTQARALGKPIFQVVKADSGAAEPPIASDLQRLDLRNDREAGLASLKKNSFKLPNRTRGLSMATTK